MTIHDVGCYSFCRHCRQVVWSGDGTVSFFQSKDGTYYAHVECMHNRHPVYASNPHQLDKNIGLWHEDWLREHPIPRVFTPAEFRPLYERARNRVA